jgi:phosphoglycerate dehydrogenase-like enzyme
MKPKVLSLLTSKRFEEVGVICPEALNLFFHPVIAEDEIILVCRGMDFLLVPAANCPITVRVLENIPSIRMIQSTGTGYDKVDVETAARLHIPVANSPGHNVTTVAEFTIASIIALQRQFVLADKETKAGHYSSVRERLFRSGLAEMRDARLGLLGFGMIGRKVAHLARSFGARVSYFDILRAPEAVENELDVAFRDRDEVLSSCHVLSLHLPLTEQTRGIIGSRAFGLMPRGSLLINSSRGELVDPEALAYALETEHLGGAAIDTLSPEPPPPSHPLLNLSSRARDRLLITPHIAGIGKGAMKRMLDAALENILRVASGEPPKNVVNGVTDARRTLPLDRNPPRQRS